MGHLSPFRNVPYYKRKEASFSLDDAIFWERTSALGLYVFSVAADGASGWRLCSKTPLCITTSPNSQIKTARMVQSCVAEGFSVQIRIFCKSEVIVWPVIREMVIRICRSWRRLTTKSHFIASSAVTFVATILREPMDWCIMQAHVPFFISCCEKLLAELQYELSCSVVVFDIASYMSADPCRRLLSDLP